MKHRDVKTAESEREREKNERKGKENFSPAPPCGTQGYIWHAMRGPFFWAICLILLSFFLYNLSASGDYRHLSFPFCNESLPRINFVILSPSFYSSKTFPNLVHSKTFNKNFFPGGSKSARLGQNCYIPTLKN